MTAHLKGFNIDVLFNQGLDEHNSGNLSAAKKTYREILAIQPDHCEANHNIGIVLVAENELEKALEFFKFALTASPNVGLFWSSYIATLAKLKRIIEAKVLIKAAKNSGMFCENIEAISRRLDIENQEPFVKDTYEIDEFINQKKLADAIEACLNLLETYPSSASVNITLGKCYFELGQMDLAISSYSKATEYWPQSAVSFVMLGEIYSLQGNMAKAIESLMRAVKLKPDVHEINLVLGVELIKKGDVDEGIFYLKKALLQDPNSTRTLAALGTAFKINGDLELAITHHKHALRLDPQDPISHFNMGNALRAAGSFGSAIKSYKQAVKIKPDYAQVYFNMGNTLKDNADLEAAIGSYNQAIKINPNYGDAYANKGNALKAAGRIRASIKSYNQALKINPDDVETLFNRSIAYLLQGDFKNGWFQYDSRLKLDGFKHANSISNKPKWKPTDGGRVLLWGEQGIGDQIKYASQIPDLLLLCSKLIIQIDQRLIPLFERSFSDKITFYSKEQKVPEELYDAYILTGSLPKYLRKTVNSFTSVSQGWLSACSVKTDNLREKLLSDGSETLIGISWNSARIRSDALNQAISLTQLATAVHAPKVKLINLQYGDVHKELSALSEKFGIDVVQISEIDNSEDLDGLAALIMACDEVVSISNATIHLAGALGKEAQVLLHSSCHWIWGEKRSNSYWYGSVCSHRQKKMGDWSNAMTSLREYLLKV